MLRRLAVLYLNVTLVHEFVTTTLASTFRRHQRAKYRDEALIVHLDPKEL